MALFGKKDKTVTCAICGREDKTGFFRSMGQKEIQGHYVCKSCYGVVDIPYNKFSKMTLDDFRTYRAFREENQKLKNSFQITKKINLSDFTFHMDTDKRLLCFSKDLSTTIFEGKHIRSFTIKEDDCVIFDGSNKGLKYYPSNVREKVLAALPQLQKYQTEMNLYKERLEKAPDDQKEAVRNSKPVLHAPRPFKQFNFELQFDHPYWDRKTTYVYAPYFDEAHPDVNDYLIAYNNQLTTMEQLANALMDMAFPGAQKQAATAVKPIATVITAESTGAPADTVAELKRYKELLDMGILTQEEFAAKKKQLLGL